MTGPWQVYLVRCADDTFYCGVTSNLERRINQHNGKLAGGAKYTRNRRPVALAAVIECRSQSEALKMEATLKSMKRSEKLRYFKVSL